MRRRIALGVAVVLCGILALWPEHYLARAQIIPEDKTTGISSRLESYVGASVGMLRNMFDDQELIEADVAVARSDVVLNDVADRLRRTRFGASGGRALDAQRIRHEIDVEAIRGGIIQITARDNDASATKAMVEAYVAATQARIAELNRGEMEVRKAVAFKRMSQAESDLLVAQRDLDRFRAAHRLAAPESQLGPAVDVAAGLQARLQAQRAELQGLAPFVTDHNIMAQSVRAQIAATENQIASAQARTDSVMGPTVGTITPILTQYANLYRAAKYYEVQGYFYKQYLESVSADEMSADVVMKLVQPAYLERERQYNASFLGGAALLIFIAVLAEIYIAQPPIGSLRSAI
jgi:hypothetical protein